MKVVSMNLQNTSPFKLKVTKNQENYLASMIKKITLYKQNKNVHGTVLLENPL